MKKLSQKPHGNSYLTDKDVKELPKKYQLLFICGAFSFYFGLLLIVLLNIY
jgi:tRNA G37 N-methylase TrmD